MKTPERVIGGTFAVLLAMSGTAAGQSSAAWQVNRGDNFVAAGICQAGSDRHCVRLQCLTMEGGGISWGIDAPEPGYSAESVSVTWTIDGAAVSLPMNKAGPADTGMQSYDAAFSQTDHQNLVQRLKRGNRLTLNSDQFAAFTLSLRGSGAALTTMLAECPLIASMDTPSASSGSSSYPPAMDPLILETVEMCINIGGKAQLLDGSVQSKDINGDGKPDYLLDLGKLSCGTGLSPYCGAANCEFAVYVSHGDDYVSGLYLGIEPRFGDDAILIPCPGSTRFSEIRLIGGSLKQTLCNE